MKIILWNIQGGRRPQAIAELINMKNNFQPDILFVLETMTNNNNSTNITKALRFQKSLIIEPTNHSGGIWVCWNEDKIRVLNHTLTSRCAHLTVLHLTLNSKFLVSGAYFPAQEPHKDTFWEEMTIFYQQIQLPWMLIGDFNELLNPADKLGGNLITSSLIASLNASDIPCLQEGFSWKSNKTDLLLQRLDRAISNGPFLDIFRNSIIKYGSFTVSYHAPVLFHRMTTPEM